MSSDDENLYDENLVGAEKARKPRGCLFYGCLFAAILAVLAVVGGGLLLFFGYRYVVGAVLPYTDTAPTPLPRVELPPEESKALHARIDAFKAALDSGEPTGPLVLTADEINALIAENPDFRDKVHIDIDGDRVLGEVSIPLESFGIPAFKGRYLNGKATLNVSLAAGILVVNLEALEVKGKPVPDSFIQQVRTQNLAESMARDPKNAEAIAKFESIRVEDGKVIIKARSDSAETPEEKAKPGDEAKPEDQAKTTDESGPVEESKPEATPKPDEAKPDDAPKAEEDAKPEGPAEPKGEPATPGDAGGAGRPERALLEV